jgi:hypothetical protein
MENDNIVRGQFLHWENLDNILLPSEKKVWRLFLVGRFYFEVIALVETEEEAIELSCKINEKFLKSHGIKVETSEAGREDDVVRALRKAGKIYCLYGNSPIHRAV